MEEWKEYKLGDICTIVGRIGFRGYTTDDLTNSPNDGAITLSPTNIVAGELDLSKPTYIKWPKYYESPEIMLEQGDIVLVKTGSSIGRTTRIREVKHPMTLNPQFVVLKDIKVNNVFLSYVIKSPYFQALLRAITVGSAIPTLSQKNLAKLTVQVPDISTQKEIASILSSLDDKIEVNKRINDNLEQQAQALFKSWFVDFEPFRDGEFVDSELGRIPKGWRVGCIGDYCKVRSGFAFKSSWWTEKGIRVIKIKNISGDFRLDMTDCSFVSEEHAQLAKEFMTKEGDLLIAMTGATIGKFCIVPTNDHLCVNQRVGKFFLGSNPLERLPFVYYNLKRSNVFDEIVQRGQGSAQPNISAKDIETINIIIPNDEIIIQFNKSVLPFIKRMIKNERESHRLAELRDTLLPKLMSGELKVN